jgi:hypothetical protein
MAWPESLTVEEQQAVQDHCTSCRSWSALLSQINNLGAAIAASWSGGISTLVGDLQPGDTIPNTSGMAGSQDLTTTDVTNLSQWANALSNQASSDQGTGAYASLLIQQTLVKAAGINASVSGITIRTG